MDWKVTETGADLTLVRAGLEQMTLLDDLTPVVNTGAGHVVNGAGVGTSCLGRAGQTLLQQEGGTQQQQLGHLWPASHKGNISLNNTETSIT